MEYFLDGGADKVQRREICVLRGATKETKLMRTIIPSLSMTTPILVKKTLHMRRKHLI
jgi:hypothetical protein